MATNSEGGKQRYPVALPGNNSHPRLTVHDLNPYIWEEVFNMMTLQDKFTLALAGQFFHRLFKDLICPRMPRRFNLEHLLSYTCAEIGPLLRALREHTTELEVPAVGFHWLNWIHQTFQRHIKKNLREVKYLRVLGQHPRVAIHYCFALDCVTELELYDCKLEDQNIEAMSAMRNLKALGLAKNRDITGKYIDELPELQKLSIFQCSQIEPIHLIRILSKHILSYLDMRLINYKGTTRPLLRLLTRIEYFRADVRLCRLVCVNCRMFAQLANLTALELDGRLFSYTNDHAITRILENVNREMQELRLTTAGALITKALMRAIRSLQDLRLLHLSNYHVDLGRRTYFQSSITALGKLEELAYREAGNGINLVLPMLPALLKLGLLSVSAKSGFSQNDLQAIVDILKERDKQSTVKPLVLNVCGPMLPRRLLESLCKDSNGVIRVTLKTQKELSGSLYEACNAL